MNAMVKTAKLGTLKEVTIRACSWLGADPEKRKKDRALRKKNEVGFGLGRLKPSRNTPPPTPEPQEVCLQGTATLFACVSQLYGKLHI